MPRKQVFVEWLAGDDGHNHHLSEFCSKAPWRYGKTLTLNTEIRTFIESAKGDKIATVHHANTSEGHANLYVLIKAPELMAQLRALQAELELATTQIAQLRGDWGEADPDEEPS